MFPRSTPEQSGALWSTPELSGEGSALQRAPEEGLTAPEPPEPSRGRPAAPDAPEPPEPPEYNFIPEHKLILLMILVPF
jgi:hypothetical protein